MELTIAILLTALATAVLAYLLFRSVLGQQSAVLKQQVDSLTASIKEADNQRNQLQKERGELLSRVATEQALRQKDQEHFREKLATQEAELEKIGEKFRFEFRTLAQSILEEKSDKFTKTNEEKIKAILDPLKAEIGEFKQKVEETYDKESKERFSLAKEVHRLSELSAQVSVEANNLTNALKGNVKAQGDWGELILESLLENSGLTRGTQFFTQEYIRDEAGNIIKDENGKGLQPDVIIHYPDMRKVIIDSKVSLLAWDAYVAAADADSQAEQLRALGASVRAHIDGLSKKNYPRYAEALDYVLMFVPIEPAFLEVVKYDKLIWKYAYDRKILMVSPTNLMAVLKIIADLWKVEQQNKHAIEIAERAGSLYDKFVGFIENLEMVGKRLGEAKNSYDAAYKQLSSGRGNLVGKVEELRKMGAKAEKRLAGKLLSEANAEEVEENGMMETN